MKEYIGRDLFDEDGNVVGREYSGELIRCKDCKYAVDEYNDGECYCDYNRELRYIKDWNHYCGWAEREKETERTCYNCKHGAFGFDGDLGCSLWHRGNFGPEKCECWVGFGRKEE